ncbi:MAG: VWA domain-containing protein [Vicinamibacterales bacterium]|jgi:Ca-activated chloride channel family protein|nr:VWA domain-containing protein [Vicinamibacterales bacterium]
MIDLDLPQLVVASALVVAALAALAVHARGWRADLAALPGAAGGHAPRAVGAGPRWGRAVALVSLALAAASPALRAGRPDTAGGPTLVLVLDVSMSMGATDVSPSRLEEAKRQIAAGVEAPFGGRVALLAFTADATLVCPPTTDLVAFADLLAATREDAATPGLSLAAPALARALDLVGRGEGDVVLVSDGEFPDEDRRQLQDVMREAARRGVRISTVGVGTDGGAPVPVRGSATGQVLTDQAGAPLSSRLDAAVLRWLAEEGGGRYVALEPGGRFDVVAMTERLRLAGSGTPARLKPFGPVSVFGYPLALGVTLLSVDAWLAWRRRRAR